MLELVRRRLHPSVFQVFASESLPAASFSWEPAFTLHLDLRASLSEIRSKFRKSVRNSLSRAIRNGIKAECASSASAIDDAFELLQTTASSKRFALPPKTYLEAIHTSFHRKDLSEVVVARQQGSDPLAVVHVIGARGIASWWKGGASATGYRLNASLVAHWRAIEIAKERGYEKYDLGGTHPSDPAYSKIHRFKSSLGGTLVKTAVGQRLTAIVRALTRVASF